MLSPADAEVARRDGALPGLAAVLDPEAVANALAGALPGLAVTSAAPTYTRYKPGTSCIVAYRLRTSGGDAIGYAKTWSDASARKREKARRRWDAAVRDGLPPLVETPHFLFFLYPHDAKLEVLERIGDVEARARLLSKVVSDCEHLWDCEVELLRYKPERRLVGRLLGGAGSEAAIRFYTAVDFANANCAAKHLKSRGRLRLARRIGAWKRRQVLALEWLPGASLARALGAAAAPSALCEAVGAALAELHAQRERRLRVRGAGAEHADLAAASETLAFLRPDLGRRVAQLGSRISRELALHERSDCTLHGDFYADQVLVDGDRIAVLDLDRASRGDRCVDLGTFIAHVERDRAVGRIEAGDAYARVGAFLHGYETSWREPLRGVEAQTAAGLLRLAVEPFRSRLPDWSRRTEAILESAEANLAAASPSSGAALRGARPTAVVEPAVVEAGSAADDVELPQLELALDPEVAGPALEGVLAGDGESLRLCGIRVRRHLPGRRCLIEYEAELSTPGAVSESLAVLGKLRRRGVDEHALQLSRSLWRAGFGPDSADGVSIPEPLGAVPELSMWLQRRVPGVAATQVLEGSGGVACASRIAEAIAKFHRAGARWELERRHTGADEIRILGERLEWAARERPAWRGRLERIREACERCLGRLPETAPVGIHRDFYPAQLIVAGERLHIVDLDLCCMGDPALDAGNFIAHLTEQSLRVRGDPAALADRERAFEERFLELAGEWRRGAVHAYALLSLARHIQICMRIPERRETANDVLELCEERLGVAQPGRP